MAPTPRVENFEDMGAQRHKPVYAPSFPFPGVSNPANLDPKVVTNIHHSSYMLTLKLRATLSRMLNMPSPKEAVGNIHQHHNPHLE